MQIDYEYARQIEDRLTGLPPEIVCDLAERWAAGSLERCDCEESHEAVSRAASIDTTNPNHDAGQIACFANFAAKRWMVRALDPEQVEARGAARMGGAHWVHAEQCDSIAHAKKLEHAK